MKQMRLQRFAEGAPAGAEPAAAPETTPGATPGTEPAPAPGEQPRRSFQELIEGEYKADYDRCLNEQVRELALRARDRARQAQAAQGRQAGEQGRRAYGELLAEARAAAAAYPGMDLKAELQDPAFGRLLGAGVDVKTAYELAHREELLTGAMRYTAQTVAEKLAQSLPGRTARPLANGAEAQAPADPGPDAAHMTRAQRRALIARARAGERIEL